MIDVLFAGLVGFAIGVAAMAGYGYSVASLTLVQEENRATPQPAIELWEGSRNRSCGEVSPDRDHMCTMTRGHGGPVHLEIDPMFGLPRGAWLATPTGSGDGD